MFRVHTQVPGAEQAHNLMVLARQLTLTSKPSLVGSAKRGEREKEEKSGEESAGGAEEEKPADVRVRPTPDYFGFPLNTNV